ncbi:hypothetical protein V7S43_015772 [Phytophthora oleae]|uniref:RxLR effector protein n=1 Tax=Phytophthora oleae TaxID=2107226 RepID=A0ABD3F238_9STRA
MHLLRLVLTFVVALAVVSNGTPASANEITTVTTVKSSLIQDAATSSDNKATRELTDLEGDEERQGGGRGGRGGGGRGTSRGTGGGTGYTGGYGYTYGTHTNIGFMNTNRISERHKKCNRFVNWFKRLFNKNIKKCPKKKDEDKRRLRA